MAWIYIKRKDKPQVHYVTEEAYAATFKEQGFEIVENADNSGSTAQSIVGGENVQPTPEKPIKRQYNKHKAEQGNV
ncbi:MAG: hypothetical protein NC131_01040 [Roseburia sp.]|nr:hypothetical protein [Roseburia sp.]